MSKYFLEMKDIKKSFSSNLVLNGVSLLVKHGEVHALMGENGAGKSTLMKILMGIHQKDGGEIFIGGVKSEIHSPKQAISLGVSMIHQELNPVLDMMVCENIFVGREPFKTVLGVKIVDEKYMIEETRKLLLDIELDISPTAKMRDLSIAETQLIEIVKAISQNAKIIVMDEPTSALTEKEAKILFKQIRKLKENGISIIYISHKLEEIFEICDAITVMRDGLYIDRLETKQASRDELISKMVGRELLDIYPKTDAVISDTVLEVKNLSYKNKVKDVSFSLKKGEILGIAGLVGSGRSETASTIFGLFKKSSGDIYINGKKVEINRPIDAIKLKLAYITEDRKVTGLNLIESIRHNITIVAIKKLTKNKLLNNKNEVRVSKEYIDMLKIKTTSHEKVVKLLSGGNQQKVAISKWLVNDPDIIIFDEPTRGIDVGAKRDIYLLMCELVKKGKSIIMISSEMPEVMGMSDRILVFAEGRVNGEILRKDFNEQAILNKQFV